MKKRNSNIITILVVAAVVGAIAYLIGINQARPSAGQASNETASSSDMSSHHGTASGPTTNPQSLVGKPAPDFSLSDRDGKRYSLADLKGKNIVLFFNEGLMCYPSCWNQIVALAQDKRFNTDSTVALSIVIDSAKDWQQAVNKMPALGGATVLYDSRATVSSAYGMLTTASSMHYGRYPGHSYVIIGKDGIVKHALDDPRMGIHNDQIADELAKLGA